MIVTTAFMELLWEVVHCLIIHCEMELFTNAECIWKQRKRNMGNQHQTQAIKTMKEKQRSLLKGLNSFIERSMCRKAINLYLFGPRCVCVNKK